MFLRGHSLRPAEAALWLLLLGMSIRLLALNRSLVDTHMFRQL